MKQKAGKLSIALVLPVVLVLAVGFAICEAGLAFFLSLRGDLRYWRALWNGQPNPDKHLWRTE